MRILITGGAGMVGRNLRTHVRASEHAVIAPSRAELDLSDAAGVLEFVWRSRPDMIIHAAGRVGGIQANVAANAAFLVDNFDMGRNVVLAAAESGVPKLMNLSSSCVYPPGHDTPLKEDMILQGGLEPTNEGYALAKIAVMRLCAFLVRERPGLSYKTIVPCNLYGLYDRFDPTTAHLVPAVLAKLHKARRERAGSVDIWGDGQARREFMFSSDFADFVWLAVARFDELPSTLNVGVGEDFSIDDYYREAAAVVGWTGEFVHDLSRPAGMRRKLMDVSLMRAFGWSPATSLADGLRSTWRHYLSDVVQEDALG